MFINIRNISKFTAPFRSQLIIDAYRPWVNKDGKIVDIGCGNGVTTKKIIENFQVDVTGCDIENYLDVTLSFYLIPKSGRLPFPNQSFDFAMLNDVLHHIDKSYHIKIIKEALRVAKKVLIFEAEPTLRGKIFDLILNKLHYGSLETPLSFRRREEWLELFKKTGLLCTIRSVKRPFWYPFLHMAMMVKERKNK